VATIQDVRRDAPGTGSHAPDAILANSAFDEAESGSVRVVSLRLRQPHWTRRWSRQVGADDLAGCIGVADYFESCGSMRSSIGDMGIEAADVRRVPSNVNRHDLERRHVIASPVIVRFMRSDPDA